MQKLFISTIVLGVCAAATVTDVEKIKLPNSDEGQDLKTAESTNRQFGHGGLFFFLNLFFELFFRFKIIFSGYGGYPSGFGGKIDQ